MHNLVMYIVHFLLQSLLFILRRYYCRWKTANLYTPLAVMATDHEQWGYFIAPHLLCFGKFVCFESHLPGTIAFISAAKSWAVILLLPVSCICLRTWVRHFPDSISQLITWMANVLQTEPWQSLMHWEIPNQFINIIVIIKI